METRRKVGNRQFRILKTQSEGTWHANVSPVPPPDGRTYTLPLWTCAASSEQALEEKLARHFQELLAAQRNGQ